MNYEMITTSYHSDVSPDSMIKECDKPDRNRNVLNDGFVEQTVPDLTYTQFEVEKGEIKVIIEYPRKSENEMEIHEEVKQILSNLLQEQIEKIS